MHLDYPVLRLLQLPRMRVWRNDQALRSRSQEWLIIAGKRHEDERNTEFQDCVGRRCRKFRTRCQHRRSNANDRCPGMWMETASCETEPVLTPARWKWTPTVSRKPSHVVSFLVRRRLTGIHTSEWRVHWPLPRSGDGSATRGRAGRCGNWLEGVGRIQADAGRSSIHRSRRGHSDLKQRVLPMQRRKWNTDRRSRTNVKQLCGSIVRNNKMFKEMNYVKTNDQQW